MLQAGVPNAQRHDGVLLKLKGSVAFLLADTY